MSEFQMREMMRHAEMTHLLLYALISCPPIQNPGHPVAIMAAKVARDELMYRWEKKRAKDLGTTSPDDE
jgi:hypothetical protein